MKTFNFYIPSEDYTFSFSLETAISDGFTYVDATKLRPPYDTPMSQMANIQPLMSEINGFQNDLDSFVSFMIQIGGKVTRDMLIQAHLKLCRKHINQYGRLLVNDLLCYADLATLVANAIYRLDEDDCHAFHWKCMMDAKNNFNDSIKLGIFGV